MKIFLLLGLLINSFSLFARQNDLYVCKVQVITLRESIQAGIIYTRSDTVNADIVIYGPVDESKTCEDSRLVEIKRLPVRISAKNSIGISVALSVRKNQFITVRNWEGNSLEDILGTYTGIQAGLNLFLGTGVDAMVKTDFKSMVTLTSRSFEVMLAKVDLSLVRFSLKKVTSSKSKVNDWNLVLREHL